MRLRNYWSVLALSLSVFSISCGGDGQQSQQQKPLVKVVDVIKKDVPVYREFVGEVYGLYDIPIRARVDGYLEERKFQEGSNVKKGQLLYVIDSQPYEAEVASKKSEVAEAQTILVNAENDLKRIRPLAEKNAMSQLDLDAAVADEGAARASLDAAKAKLRIAEINLGYTSIKSPIDGIIGKTKAKRGEYVGKEPNPVILNTISRIDTILVQFFITESDYLDVAREIMQDMEKRGDDLAPRRKDHLSLILADGSVHNHIGNIDFVDRNIDPTTGSMLVQASFPNPDQLVRPGQFARVKIETKIEKDAKLIPSRCIVSIQGKSNVYVVNNEGTAEMREIKIAASYGDLTLVSSGIEHGDQIVIEGLQMIRSGVPVETEKISFESKSDNPF